MLAIRLQLLGKSDIAVREENGHFGPVPDLCQPTAGTSNHKIPSRAKRAAGLWALNVELLDVGLYVPDALVEIAMMPKPDPFTLCVTQTSLESLLGANSLTLIRAMR
jgi:hypothetical protein